MSFGASAYKDRQVRQFVDHINDCLSCIERELTEDAVDRLSEYASEILANAEEHSQRSEWVVSGYYDAKDSHGLCEIAIFNIGLTIAQTFNNLPDDSYAIACVKPYIDIHKDNGFFGSTWTKDDLLTLAALQGDISSKNRTSDDTRGQGTVEMIQFFQKIQQECNNNDDLPAKMAIVSGSTHVLFDGTYQMRRDEKGRKIIAFNQENSLLQPPDKQYVRSLQNTHFSGTIISIRFYLHESQTQEIA